jgi:RimJ/RimL family protein N-acetyltransferase
VKRPQHVDPPNPPLSDGTVALRPMQESDLQALLEEGNDPDTRIWVNVPVPYTERHARDELEGWMAAWDDPARPLALTITEVGDDAYRGVVLVGTNRPEGIVELAYGVHPQARRKGYASRAVRLVARWALTGLGATRVEARADPDNAASQGVLQSAGLTREGLERKSRSVQGELKDMVCWSLIPSDLDG